MVVRLLKRLFGAGDAAPEKESEPTSVAEVKRAPTEARSGAPRHEDKSMNQENRDEKISYSGVGPIVRSGELAEVVIDAIIDDNPDSEVDLVYQGDYVRIHIDRRCLLKQSTLEKHLGYPFDLSLLEAEMPSFAGRLKTVNREYLWYYET